MSSMRNAVARRPHRERAQPLERKRLGLLEKHKDYTLRAQDFNKKKKTLKNLQSKADERNEDEFYFGMMSRKGPGSKLKDGKKWQGTVAGDRGNKSLDVDTVRLLKTQDLGYVRTMRQVVSKEVAQLEEQVVLTRGFNKLDKEEEEEEEEDDGSDSEFDFATAPSKPKAPRKIVFMDDEQEREEILGDRLDMDDEDEKKEDSKDDEERAKNLRRLRSQLENARKKLKVLTDAEHELEIQRAKMAKTKTSGGTTRKGKKIMIRTRKR